jgi:hypothetical protein
MRYVSVATRQGCCTVPEPGRWSTIVKYVVGALAVAALGVSLAHLLQGPFFSFSTKTWSPELRGNKMVGGIQGPVKIADPQTSTLRISSGFLGLASLPVVVTPQTKIMVNGKLGGFADLDRGQFVRVAYEMLPDRLVASLVEVFDRSSDLPDGPMPQLDRDAPAVERASTPDTKPEPVPARAAEPPSRAAAPPAAPVTAKTPPVAPWTAVPLPAPASPPPAPPTPSARSTAVSPAPSAKRPVAGPSSSPRVSQETPRPASPASPPPARQAVTPGSPQAEDGGPVIDWLLKQPRP